MGGEELFIPGTNGHWNGNPLYAPKPPPEKNWIPTIMVAFMVVTVLLALIPAILVILFC